jgi:hypothetical protein
MRAIDAGRVILRLRRVELIFRHGRFGAREWEGPSWPGIVGVAGRDVRVQVGNGVAENVVVELGGSERGRDRARRVATSRP